MIHLQVQHQEPKKNMSKRKRITSIASIMTVDEIEEIKKKRLEEKEKKRIDEEKKSFDFITMILLKWSFDDIVNITKWIIIILNRGSINEKELKYPSEYEETLFSNHTSIILSEFNEESNSYYEKKISFRLYYNMIYNDSYDYQQNCAVQNIDLINHKKMLLKLCFLIAFSYDPRITRFVMTRHFMHINIFKTISPNSEKTKIFLKKARLHINYFLNNQNEIDDVVNKCIELWINHNIMSVKI